MWLKPIKKIFKNKKTVNSVWEQVAAVGAIKSLRRKQETGQEQKRGEETKGKKVAVFPDDVTEGKKSSRALEKEKVFQFENDGVEKIRANFCKFLRLTRKNADRR